MSRIRSATTIARPPDEVFAYVSTPRTWPAWQPSSLGVAGATGHSLDVAERFNEQYIMAGRRGSRDWFVRERDPGRRWMIEAVPSGGGSGTLVYAFTPLDGGTRVECEFEYDMGNVVLSLLDALVLRRRVAGESTAALLRLKERLESGSAAAAAR
jgi:uncharacterized protein YndB with AHSA1/START domain